MRILFLPYTAATWKQARYVGPGLHYGLANAMEGLGHRVVVRSTPAIPTLRKFYGGDEFDQVWADLLHIPDEHAEFIRSLSNVVVGIGAESWKDTYEKKIPYCTHLLMLDPVDVKRVQAMGKPAMHWIPTIHCEGVRPYVPAQHSTAAFCGRIYGSRQKILAACRNEIAHVEYEDSTRKEYADLERFLASGKVVNDDPDEFVDGCFKLDYLERVARNVSLADSCIALQKHVAVVNLPTVCRFFPDRVYRALAVGTPVISVKYSDEISRMFEPQEGILYFASEAELKFHIKELNNPEYRQAVGEAGQTRLVKDYLLESWTTRAIAWAASTN